MSLEELQKLIQFHCGTCEACQKIVADIAEAKTVNDVKAVVAGRLCEKSIAAIREAAASIVVAPVGPYDVKMPRSDKTSKMYVKTEFTNTMLGNITRFTFIPVDQSQPRFQQNELFTADILDALRHLGMLGSVSSPAVSNIRARPVRVTVDKSSPLIKLDVTEASTYGDGAVLAVSVDVAGRAMFISPDVKDFVPTAMPLV